MLRLPGFEMETGDDKTAELSAQALSAWLTRKIAVAMCVVGSLIVGSGCRSKETPNEGAKTQQAAKAAPTTYQPVGHGFAFFKPVNADFNHNGSGEQGVLLEVLQNSVRPGDGSGLGYYYLLYNHKIAKNTQPNSTVMCDLQDMLKDSQGAPYKQLSFTVDGEGAISDKRIGLENERVVAVGLPPCVRQVAKIR